MFPVDSENGLVDVVEKVKGNLAEEVLENLEKYWEDISDRLMISRMVSDSVIKGMVTAVEQDAAEKIAAKELEVVQKAYEVVGKYGKFSCSSKKNEKIREELNALRNLARDQFDKVKEEIERAKIGSDSESESWINHVNKMLDCLKTKLDTVCGKVDDILLSSKISFCESQENQDLLAKLEEFEEKSLLEQNAQFCGIIQNMNWLEKFNDISSLGTKLESILKSLETGLVSDHGSHDLDHLHHKTSLCGENGTEEDASNIHVGESYDFQQLKHMSNEELVNYFKNIITKMKRDHESALQQKTEELFRLKREYPKEKRSFMKDEEFDVLRKKIPEVISKLNDFLLENERFPALITDNLESMGKLKHKLESLMSENQRLRDCLADTENEVKCLKAQVSGAAVAEENMLKENLKSEVEDSCIKASLNEEIYKSAVREQIAQTRLESLISENHQLRDRLTDMDNAVKCLKEQLVSGAAAKMLRHSPVEEDILKLLENLKSALEDSCIKASLNEEIYKSAIREQIAQTRLESLTSENRQLRDHLTDAENLKSAVEDSCIEASLNEEICKSAIREQIAQIRCDSEDSKMEFLITRQIYNIILKEAAGLAETAKRYWIEDSDIELLIMQGLDGLIFTEAIRDAVRQLDNLYWKVVVDEEIRIFLETEALEMENELTLEVEEKEKLRTAMKQEEMLAMDLSVLLSKEREIVSRELISLQEHASRQEKDLESLRSQYSEALKQIEVDKMEMQKLDQTKVELTEANRERNEASTLAQEMCDKLLLSEAREQTLKKGMEMAADGFSKIFDDFEGRVSEAMNKNSLRLEDASSQLKALTEMAKVLRRTGQMYKQKLERRCSDLRMAEAEVDLLGDEVDACLRLLEKIYIALDHYSPVLKHYSGIIEILVLVRRELSGESTIPTVVNSMARRESRLT